MPSTTGTITISSRPPPHNDHRATRIRENQRRSRARKREYLESLEARLKRCQEEGVQANVDLQRAARKVVDENRMLRAILNEKGVDDAYVELRLAELGGSASGSGSADGTEALDAVYKMPAEFEAGPDDLWMFGTTSEATAGGFDDMDIANSATPPTPFSLDVFMSPTTPNMILDSKNPLELVFTPAPAPPSCCSPSPTGLAAAACPQTSQALGIPPLPPVPSLQPSPAVSLPPQPSSIATPTLVPPQPIPEEGPGGCCPTTPSTCGPLGICPPMTVPVRTVSKETSTPCAVAYKLLKALNETRKKEKDMFEIVMELYQGFGDVPEEERDGDGCRVDDVVLFKVVQSMVEK